MFSNVTGGAVAEHLAKTLFGAGNSCRSFRGGRLAGVLDVARHKSSLSSFQTVVVGAGYYAAACECRGLVLVGQCRDDRAQCVLLATSQG